LDIDILKLDIEIRNLGVDISNLDVQSPNSYVELCQTLDPDISILGAEI